MLKFFDISIGIDSTNYSVYAIVSPRDISPI